MEIVGGAFVASAIATFALLWKKAGVLKTVAAVWGVMLVCLLALTWLFHEIYPAPSPARNAAFVQWFTFGGLAVVGGPAIGALLAWYSRRRFAQFRALAGGKPDGGGG
jgi:hypothetical protein